MSVWYVCLVFDPDSAKRFNITSASTAAYNKVLGVSAALKAVGVDVSVISLAMGRSDKGHRILPFTVTIQNILFRYCFAFNVTIVKNIIAALSFFCCSLRRRNEFSHVILYNLRPEYLLGALLNRILGKQIILDLEDSINTDDSRLNVFISKLLLKIYLGLAQSKLLTVSNKLLDSIDYSVGCVSYGACNEFADLPRSFDTDIITIIFGGALFNETGVPMFLQFLKQIAKRENIDRSLRIVITGFGPLALEVEETVKKFTFVKYYGNVTRTEYLDILTHCQVALVLKDPGTSMGQTTFPSKIVELSSAGLLMIVTPVSDIPDLFDDEEVYFVNSVAELELSVLHIIKHRDLAFNRAKKSLLKAKLLFDSYSVGSRIKNTFGM